MAAFVILTLYASTILNIKTFKSSASAYEMKAHPTWVLENYISVTLHPCQPIHSCFFRRQVLQTISDNLAVPHGDLYRCISQQHEDSSDPISSILCTEITNFHIHVLDLRDTWRMKGRIYFKHCDISLYSLLSQKL